MRPERLGRFERTLSDTQRVQLAALATSRSMPRHAEAGFVLTALNTTVTYVRDLRDAITERSLTVGSNAFNHWHEYDSRGLLWKVFASTGSTKPATADVTFTYRPSGQVQDRQFPGGPLVPLRYTIREQLEKIGDPALTSYPFSARYAYHANGNVQEAEFYSAGSPAAQKRYKYAFPTYDALNRLRSADFSSWNGSAWTTTLAHDLATIGYDAAGNLTALQRYRETGTLLDNLTYAYPGSNNRLSSVSDVVGGTAESWDAESGAFTYDANGNLLTAPAPYGLSAVIYDERNLPLTLTSNGTPSTYRYDEAGQRIAKRVGSGNGEFYVHDGAVTLAVVTVDGAGAPVSWHFNVLAGDRPIGRQPNVGNRRYYHGDLLGSTRATVDGAIVLESYDYEPMGLLMPGRTLGSGTKEGFTGKERDGETGFDYFGARYYLAALGRWGSVDPLAEKHPEWSPYNYVLGNPMVLLDPDGRQISPNMEVTQVRTHEFDASDSYALFNQMRHLAPAINHEVTWFLPKNLGSALAGMGAGRLLGGLFGRSTGAAASGVALSSRVAKLEPMMVRASSSATTAEAEGPFVYRGLARGEDVSKGLSARAPEATNDPLSHVAGKRPTQWISTTKSLEIARKRYGTYGVVRIDLAKVPADVVDVSAGFPGKAKMLSAWAKTAQEVLIRRFVPAEAITPVP